MSDASNATEVSLYNWLFRPAVAVTRHTELWVGLLTAVSDADAGTGTEVTGGSYARVDITASMGAPDTTTGTGSNSVEVTFPLQTADWGLVTHAGFFSASTGGSAITRLRALSASKSVLNGEPAVRFAIGELIASVA